MKNLTFIVLIVALIGISCKKQQPEDIAKSFYQYLNTNEFQKAKELATPSAIEYVDHLKDLLGNNINGDSLEFIVMDVKKQEVPKEGDTAVVNYKIGNFKNHIKLLWTDDSYKVIYTNELPALRIVEYNPSDLYNQYKELDFQAFWEKFGDYRLRIKDILGISYGDDLYGIPYIIDNNSSPLTKSSYYNGVKYFELQFNGKNVELTGKGDNSDMDLPFVFSSFTDGQYKRKITSTFPNHLFGESSIWNSTSLFTFEGVLTSINNYHRHMYFDQCTIK